MNLSPCFPSLQCLFRTSSFTIAKVCTGDYCTGEYWAVTGFPDWQLYLTFTLSNAVVQVLHSYHRSCSLFCLGKRPACVCTRHPLTASIHKLVLKITSCSKPCADSRRHTWLLRQKRVDLLSVLIDMCRQSNMRAKKGWCYYRSEMKCFCWVMYPSKHSVRSRNVINSLIRCCQVCRFFF